MLAELLRLAPQNLDYFMLAFVRLGGLIVGSPIFGRRQIPGPVRIGFVGALTLVAVLAFPPPSGPIAYTGMLDYGLLVAKEFLFGAVVSYVLTVFLSVTSFVAGHIIDMQMGFSLVQAYDVQANEIVSVSGSLISLLMLVMFFMTESHIRLIYIMFTTFDLIPVGAVAVNAQLAMSALQLFIQTFLLAINLSLPFIAAGLLLEAAMGIIIRVMPQMNMFVVGIPLKVIGGLAMLYVSATVYTNFCASMFDQMFEGIEIMVRGLM